VPSAHQINAFATIFFALLSNGAFGSKAFQETSQVTELTISFNILGIGNIDTSDVVSKEKSFEMLQSADILRWNLTKRILTSVSSMRSECDVEVVSCSLLK
jgi:hypothetical protein